MSSRVVPYSAEHKALVADLARHLWSPNPSLNERYLEWKYHQNPYIQGPLVYLAFAGNRLVGMRGAFGSRWEANNPTEFFVLPYADDLVIDPDFRRQGLHRVIMTFALRDLARRGYRYVVNLSAGKVTAIASRNMRWRDAGRVGALYRRTLRKTTVDFLTDLARPLPLLWRWADDFSALSGCSGDRLFDRLDASLRERDLSRDEGSTFVRKSPLVREMSDLVARLPGDGRIRHVRDEVYFAWRLGNPLYDYRFLYIGRERLQGYMVLQRSPFVVGEFSKCVSIVDWEAESDQARAGLLDAVIEHGGFPALSIWQPRASSAAGLLVERQGFKPLQRIYEKSVMVRSTSDDGPDAPWMLGGRHLDNAGQWDLRMIYAM